MIRLPLVQKPGVMDAGTPVQLKARPGVLLSYHSSSRLQAVSHQIESREAHEHTLIDSTFRRLTEL